MVSLAVSNSKERFQDAMKESMEFKIKQSENHEFEKKKRETWRYQVMKLTHNKQNLAQATVKSIMKRREETISKLGQKKALLLRESALKKLKLGDKNIEVYLNKLKNTDPKQKNTKDMFFDCLMLGLLEDKIAEQNIVLPDIKHDNTFVELETARKIQQITWIRICNNDLVRPLTLLKN